MTIGFDGSRAFIEGRTGTENYSFQLLKALAKIDTENRYLIYLRPGKEIEGVNAIKGFKDIKGFKGVKGSKTNLKSFNRLNPINSLNNSNDWPSNFTFKVLNYPRLWTQVGLAIRTWIDPLDVLFVPSHTLPLLKKPSLKTVLTVHDLGAEFLPATHQLKQVVYLNLMTHHQLKNATQLIAVSEATKKDIVKRVGIDEKKIKVIYEGVDKTIFKPISKDIVNDIVKKYDIEREKYFLFVGTIQPRKNLERLIIAFNEFLSRINTVNGEVAGSMQYVVRERKNLKQSTHTTNYILPTTNFKLVLVGQKGWKSEEIYKLPKELGIEDKVVFTGRISDSDLVGLYNGAAALTYPSLFEGFGLPIVEAFACGCPVITSNISSMAEVAGNAAILVDPYNIEAISKAMQELSSDDALRSSLIKKGILRSEKFDWISCAKETLQILQNVAGSK
jgi:glycosyltransferase involved in cell wall biosynthesis